MERKRPAVMAAGLLARPGGAPARTTPVEDLPRPALPPRTEEPKTTSPLQGGNGIKAATVGTTVYLLPTEHKRVRQLALDADVPSVHELLLLGLDQLLAERGEPPIKRYSQPRPRKS